MKYQVQKVSLEDANLRETEHTLDGEFTQEALNDWYGPWVQENPVEDGFKYELVPENHELFIRTPQEPNVSVNEPLAAQKTIKPFSGKKLATFEDVVMVEQARSLKERERKIKERQALAEHMASFKG